MEKNAIDLVRKDCEEVVADGGETALSSLRGATILVTGGTGFVGTWLSELICYLNDCHGFDTRLLLLAEQPGAFRTKAPHLASRKDITLLEKNIVNLMEIDSEVTYIVHAAANPDNRQHVSDPLKVMRVIIQGTDAVLSAASRLPNLKKMLNVSSGLIYGAQPIGLEKIAENYHGGPDCDSVLAAYPEAKRCAETLCTAYWSQYKMPVVTVRPFAFVGPYQLLDKPWAINNFINDALRGGPIRILGDENTVRSYMYPSDMAMWMLRILADGQSGRAYNLGSPEGITLRDLAHRIGDTFTVPMDIVTEGMSKPGVIRSRFVPDVDSAEKTLGLKLTVGIDEALKRAILWYRIMQGK